MQTTHPSIMLGSYIWDEDRLPRDEFDARLAALRVAMEQRNWSAVMIYGDAREHGDLAFFTNFIPRMRWAMAVLPREGEPRLLASMSSRDMPAMRTMTWIGDVKSGWEWKYVEDCVDRLPKPGAIGAIGFDLMTPLLYGRLEATLSGRHALETADDLAQSARRVHRPRETALIALAADATRTAAEAMKTSWSAGADIESVALAGERAARRLAAQDVRTLVSRDGGLTLEPYSARFDRRPERLLAYVAVKMMGYWGEQFVTADDDPLRSRAQAQMDEILAAFAPDLSIGEIERRVGRPLRGAPQFLGESLGHKIGLSLDEGDALTRNARIRPDVVYALRTAAIDEAGRAAVVSATALVAQNGSTRILARGE
jgi:hypothetical protein